jgi:hypothetical protein
LKIGSSSSASNNTLNQLKKNRLKNSKRIKNIDCKRNSKKAKFNEVLPNMVIPKNINKRNYHGETKLQEACNKVIFL